ncbi:G protein-coupled glucose receptor regulating Gpa2-domain-containing protein [Xylariales sp. PMI_506]|nr:G protein-coupled glucose receptor regulating Gpa2-domain-containing protein [Xylariales sp. PMI_506]
MAPGRGPGDGFTSLLRGDGSIRIRDAMPLTSASDIRILEGISLSTASVSVLAAFIAFYWFVRMRRSFRQDLIMLLIQSDMMKAFWLMLCPIVNLIVRGIDSNSAFCQVSGFLLTTAIASADVAVLMIAIHSALYIFRPRRSDGERGLYPYRRFAYAVWFFVPLILTAVVPLTGGRFQNTGTNCYLPVQPSWYRTCLSWYPRYIIFCIIFIVYSWVYFYINWRFMRLRRDRRRASDENSNNTAAGDQKNDADVAATVPPTPPIAYHGLLDSPADGYRLSELQRKRQQSTTSDVSTLKLDDRSNATDTPNPESQVNRSEGVAWNWVDMNYDNAPQHTSLPEGPVSDPKSVSFAGTETPEIIPPPPVHRTPSRAAPLAQGIRPSAAEPSLRRSVMSNSIPKILLSEHDTSSESTPNPFVIRDRITMTSVDTEPSSTSGLIYLTYSRTDDPIRRSRDKMSRQTRLLFIYPLIYILAWIAPFVSHVYDYDSGTNANQPFGLVVMSIASLCIGAAVDSCFFTAWEKPWRHLRGGFWQSLAMRFRIGHHHINAGGRTRDEQRRDAEAALDRRNLENAERTAAAAAVSGTRSTAQPREWWDLGEDSEDED